MAQGKALSSQQIETIRAAWILTENGSEAARRANCGVSAACAYIREHADELRTLRNEKSPELREVVRALLERTLSVAFDGKKLADAPFGQLMIGTGILIDKLQLLTGEPTERHEYRDTTEARDEFTRRIDELAERRRARGADLGVRTG